jgi:hypothetical protein
VQETAPDAAGGVSSDTRDLTIAPGSTVTARSLRLSTRRRATLTDGVFAMVMTLRVFELHAGRGQEPAAIANGTAQDYSAVDSVRRELRHRCRLLVWASHGDDALRNSIGSSAPWYYAGVSFYDQSRCVVSFVARQESRLAAGGSYLWRELFLAGIVRNDHWACVTNGSRLVVLKLDSEFVLHVRRGFTVVPCFTPDCSRALMAQYDRRDRSLGADSGALL